MRRCSLSPDEYPPTKPGMGGEVHILGRWLGNSVHFSPTLLGEVRWISNKELH